MLQNKTATQKRIQKFFNSVQSKKVYLHTKQIVCKKKKTNKQGSGTTANEKSHCWSVDSPREQMFLKKRPEIPVLS